MSELVTVERDDDVVVVYLADGARHNLLSAEMTRELADTFEELGDAGAVALLAEGEHFSLGGDVRSFGSTDDPQRHVGALAEDLHRAVLAIRQLDAPVVVGLRGWAAGAGMSLVLASDIVIAGESAMMRPAYPGIGLTPDGGMTWLLPRIVGARRASSILLGNQVLTAGQAQELGIVDDVVPDNAVDSQTIAFARRLIDGPVAALAGIKRLIRDSSERSLAEHLGAEAASIAAHAASPEGREGVRAFVERRKPDFRGARSVSTGSPLSNA